MYVRIKLFLDLTNNVNAMGATVLAVDDKGINELARNRTNAIVNMDSLLSNTNKHDHCTSNKYQYIYMYVCIHTCAKF